MTIQTIDLEISGMTCDHCSKTIENKVSAIDGLVDVSVSYPDKRGKFQYDSDKTSATEIITVINSIGSYKVVDDIKGLSDENSKYDLIIIGGGSAAFSAAIKASEFKKKVLMINEGLPVGGTCVNVGCIPSKTLIRAAEQFHISNYPGFTGIKCGKSQIDFNDIIRQKTELINGLRNAKYVDIIQDDPNVTFKKAFAKFFDKNTVEADGKKFTAENILIATGSTTFIPTIPGLEEAGYLTNENLYELKELPEHLIVIGGRYIALENAQMFARFGSRLTILQRSSRILYDEMPDVTETLRELLEAEGISILTDTKIKSVVKREGKTLINVTVNGNDQVIEGTHIFVATGRMGNTKGCGLEKSGIKIHSGSFIATNEFMQTSIPNIYAAGDVTGEYLFVYSAAYEGSLAVQNMYDEIKTKKDYAIFPWVVFTDPQIAGVGMDESMAKNNKIEYEVSIIQLKDVPRSLAARNTKGFIKLIRNKENDKLIGARILASEGSELLMEISLAIKYGITVKELRKMFHPYLTLSEGVKLAAISFDKDVKKLSCCAM